MAPHGAAAVIGWLTSLAFGGALGPAVVVQQVAAPAVVVAGPQQIQVGPFEGLGADALRAELLAALDGEAQRSGDTVKETQQAIVATREVADPSKAKSRRTRGRRAKGATRGAAVELATSVDLSPLTLRDGLSIQRFRYVEGPADAVLHAEVVVEEHIEHFRRRVPHLDMNGKPRVDAAGRQITHEVRCRRREVTAWIEWSITGQDLRRTGDFARRNGDSACAHNGAVLTDAQTLALEVLPGAGRELARQFNPYWRTTRFPLMADEHAPEAMSAILAGDWSVAYCALQRSAAERPDSLEAQLNYGIVLEAFGRHAHAAVLYDRANNLSARGVVKRADKRNGKRVDEVERMTRAWGWTYAPEPPRDCDAEG